MSHLIMSPNPGGGGGHIVFSADPVGFSVRICVASFRALSSEQFDGFSSNLHINIVRRGNELI